MDLTNKKNIIIGVVVVVAVGYYLFQSQKVAAPVQNETQSGVSTSTSETASKTGTTKSAVTSTTKVGTTLPAMTKEGYYLISYTDKGFVPKTLEIKAGKSVRFVNNASKAMRIFADDKTSSLYGEMNQSKTVGRGGIYDFTFVSAGTWAYHNENNPVDKGVVIVK